MSKKDMYTQIDLGARTVEPCPVCGSAAELWRFAKDDASPTTKAVMCSHGDTIGPQDSAIAGGCPLFIPSNDFYCATEREAIKYWNDFAGALGALRRAKHWETAKVLREAAITKGGNDVNV